MSTTLSTRTFNLRLGLGWALPGPDCERIFSANDLGGCLCFRHPALAAYLLWENSDETFGGTVALFRIGHLSLLISAISEQTP